MKKKLTEKDVIETLRELEGKDLTEEEIVAEGKRMYQVYLSAPSIEEVRARLEKKS